MESLSGTIIFHICILMKVPVRRKPGLSDIQREKLMPVSWKILAQVLP